MSHKSSCSTYVKSFASFIAQRQAVNLIIGILQGNAIFSDDTLAAFLRHLATSTRPAFTL